MAITLIENYATISEPVDPIQGSDASELTAIHDDLGKIMAMLEEMKGGGKNEVKNG